MHRTLEITVAPADTDTLCQDLAQVEGVLSLSVQHGASLKPPGDVVTVHALARAADPVVRCVSAVQPRGPLSIVTSEVSSIIDADHSHLAIDGDVDDALWEEMETGLSDQAWVTPNYLSLMALGGAVAASGLGDEPVRQAVSIVAASVIAPGFEPILKIPLGLVLRRQQLVRRGLVSLASGYAAFILAAALLFLVLRVTGTVTVPQLVHNTGVQRLAHPTLSDVLSSACATAAGAVMVTAYRRTVLSGPLIALVLFHAAALVGAALVAGQASLCAIALGRFALDIVLVVGIGALVIAIKRSTTHQRAPLV